MSASVTPSRGRSCRPRTRGALSPRLRGILAIAAAVVLLLCAGQVPRARALTTDDLLDLEALRGKVVYLDFWASWCAPCRVSFPWMNRLQRELGRDGLVIVGVNVDREQADAERFLREHPAQFRIVFDPAGTLPEKFGVHGMPTSFVIDREGQVQLRHEGFFLRDSDALAHRIRSLVIGH